MYWYYSNHVQAMVGINVPGMICSNVHAMVGITAPGTIAIMYRLWVAYMYLV